ncbi:hypothetical protein PIB30_001015 [Stylosanthes scabra]|uniref:Uncharacterized protein n=1 Tax=Stylosanthes scabra TaxID=79078 RepID=A0ABU6T266_9FABA|nr:hypothetical protein [Stylosanthes scabra]
MNSEEERTATRWQQRLEGAENTIVFRDKRRREKFGADCIGLGFCVKSRKPKSKKASTSSRTLKAKISIVPLAPTPLTIQTTNLSTVQSDASSWTKVSEGDKPPPKKSTRKETQPAPSMTDSASSDSTSTQ